MVGYVTAADAVYWPLQCYDQHLPDGREQYEEINASTAPKEGRSNTTARQGNVDYELDVNT